MSERDDYMSKELKLYLNEDAYLIVKEKFKEDFPIKL